MHDFVFFYPQGHEAHYELGHPERPDRVEAIRTAMEHAGWWQEFPHLDPVEVPNDILKAIHSPSYLNRLEIFCEAGRRFDADTYTTPASWKLAHNAAGGGIAVTSSVWDREAQSGFAITRPPGHHATADQAMGFCLLNNIAIAAEFLLSEKQAQKIAIVDIDLHHGNGTQDIFWNRADVFYASIHQSPLYPGTGRINEIGQGEGEHTNANIPLPPFSGDTASVTAIDQIILPLLDRFQPEMILISAGFDPHWLDPLGSLLLTAQGYGTLVSRIDGWAQENCHGRVAVFLEGGYDLDAGAACAQATVAALTQRSFSDPLGPPRRNETPAWETVLEQARKLWQL